VQFENKLGEFLLGGLLHIRQSHLNRVVVKRKSVLDRFGIFIILTEIPHEFAGDFTCLGGVFGRYDIVVALNFAFFFFGYFKPVLLH
jgi:hypothetical protein